MKFNKIIVVCFVFMTLLCLSCVSAADNNSTNCEINSQDDKLISSDIVENEAVLATGGLEKLAYSEVENGTMDLEVEVTNVFNGYENAITVSYPNATGNADIVVGEKTYNPIFIEGKATQIISDYDAGINNVIVKYNNLTKETSFKVLDGIVTYETFYDYFNENDEYKLQDYIPNGVTLDFQGNITYINLNKTEDFNILSININKPINIISTTNDAFIDFNGQAGSLLGEYQGSTFTIGNEGSWSNVTGITIHNTQVWVYNAHHVTLDRIRVIVEDARIGSGVGATSIRANSTWCTVKNSYFYTKNNGGSSSLVMAWADYSTFDNNTVVGEGDVGNLIYLTTYNVDFPIGIIPNCHNNITNNRMYGPSKDTSICWMLVISGEDTLLQNNTMIYTGDGIKNQWVDPSWYGGDAVPFGNTYIGNKMYGGCGMEISANSIAYGNIVGGQVTLNPNVTFYDNAAESLRCIKGGSSILYNNTIKNCAVKFDNHVIHDNIFGSVAVNGNNIAFYNNQVGSAEIVGDNIAFYNNHVDLAEIDGGVNIQINDSYFKSIYLSGLCENLTFNNNTVNDLLNVFSNNNIITNNKIYSSKEYAIDLRKTVGNIVTGNYLLSSKEFGNSAVKFTNENIIRDNFPIAPDILVDVNLINNFENTVTVTVPNSTGSIVIQVSDKKYTLTLENCIATQRISGLGPGNYTLTVDYKDNKSPIYASNETMVYVPKIDAYTFEIKETEFMEGNVIIPVYLPSDSDGKVIINGIYEGNNNVLLDLGEGEYDLEVTYANSQRYADKSIQVHIKVNHNPQCILTLQNITNYDLNGKITAKLSNYKNDPIADAKVVININGHDIEVKTDELGIACVDYKLGVGNHKVTANFKGNSNYNAVSAKSTIKILSRFSGNKNIVMDYYDGSKYSVRVLGDDGKHVGSGQLVTFNINGKKSTVKTDKNGYASLSITNVPGKYSITATYKGQSIKNSVQIKQTLKTSKVTVKKTAKSFILKATLKTSKNKAIKGKITFNFNGKTYTAKTDKNGVAKVTIKQNVIKKLKKGKKYAFTVKYVSNTIKNQVIVK